MKPKPKPPSPRQRLGFAFWTRASILTGLTLVAPLACTFDPDDRCGDGQVPYGDNERCVCAPGSAFTDAGCVACGENESPGPNGCACDVGFVRASADSACEPAPAGLGTECDTASNPCVDPSFTHCETTSGTSGYCTKTGCAGMDECEGGYACDLEVSPSLCRRPPTGLSKPCTSNADCAGTEATYCDLFVTQSCLVENCTLAPDNCFAGFECCDLSSVGVAQPLCVADGACQIQ